MKKLETIQQGNRLNDVLAMDEPGPGGVCHLYQVCKHGSAYFDSEGNLHFDPEAMLLGVQFLRGPRKSPDSVHGVLDSDLLEIVRDRLTDFQSGPFPCEENAEALRYVTEALLCLNRRRKDRTQRGVLSENKP